MIQPLRGRRIVITRSRRQASALAAELERLGALPLSVPTIDLAPPSSFQSLDRALLRASAFDWVVFTSANGVEALASRARTLDLPVSAMRIAAIGSATAQALTIAGLCPVAGPVLLPAEAVAESLADALVPRIASLLVANGRANVLLIRAEEGRDLLPEALASVGATVEVAGAYRNILPLESATLLSSLFDLSRQPPDAITFTSSSTARNLVALLDAAKVELPASVRRISIGPITSATLNDLGLPPHSEAADANISSLVQAVVSALQH